MRDYFQMKKCTQIFVMKILLQALDINLSNTFCIQPFNFFLLYKLNTQNNAKIWFFKTFFHFYCTDTEVINLI